MSQIMKFLVIDDFSTMRKIIKKTLNEMGYDQIVEAEDGSAAWTQIEKAQTENSPFHFIISDWNMPKMSGLELLQKVRTNDSTKHLPFVMVTAESEQKQILEAIKSGCSDYIVKPFTAQMVKEKINRVHDKFYAKKAA